MARKVSEKKKRFNEGKLLKDSTLGLSRAVERLEREALTHCNRDVMPPPPTTLMTDR